MNVDTTQTTHISLCSGYGGIDLGLRRVIPNLRTVAYAEIEAFACENLLARMEGGQLDAAPIWSDLKSFPWAEFSGLVDILSGGYPCQPFSAAGLRKGTEYPRHLWHFITEGIQVVRPRLCFFENVEGHISLGLREVVGELEELGYETTWGIFSAAEVGAPHQRKRVFIMAVAGGLGGAAGLSGSLAWDEGITGITDDCGAQRWPSRPGQPQHAWEPPRVVGNAEGRMSGQSSTGDWRESAGRASEGAKSMGNAESRDGQRGAQGTAGHTAQPDEGLGNASDQRHLWAKGQGSTGTKGQPDGHTSQSTRAEQHEAESTLGGDSHGPSSGLDYAKLSVSCDNRTDELRLLGNGVVPATAALAFRTLLDEVQPSVHH